MAGLNSNKTTYTTHQFGNNQTPSLSAEALNTMEAGIKEAIENRGSVPETIFNLTLGTNWIEGEDKYFYNTLLVPYGVSTSTIQEILLEDNSINKLEQENAIINAGGQIYDGGLDENNNIILKCTNPINISLNFKIVLRGKSSTKGFSIINLNLGNKKALEPVNSLCISISSDTPNKLDNQNWAICDGSSISGTISNNYYNLGKEKYKLEKKINNNSDNLIYNKTFDFFFVNGQFLNNNGITMSVYYDSEIDKNSLTFLYNNNYGLWFIDSSNKKIFKAFKQNNIIYFQYQWTIDIWQPYNFQYLVAEKSGQIYIISTSTNSGDFDYRFFYYNSFNPAIKEKTSSLTLELKNNQFLPLAYLQQRDGAKIPIVLDANFNYLYYLSFEDGVDKPKFNALQINNNMKNGNKFDSYSLADYRNYTSAYNFRVQTSYFLNAFNSNYIETNGDIIFWIDIPLVNETSTNNYIYNYQRIYCCLDEKYNLSYYIQYLLNNSYNNTELKDYISTHKNIQWSYIKDKEYLLKYYDTNKNENKFEKIVFKKGVGGPGFTPTLEISESIELNSNNIPTIYNSFNSYDDKNYINTTIGIYPDFYFGNLYIDYNFSSGVDLYNYIVSNLLFEFPLNFKPEQWFEEEQYKVLISVITPTTTTENGQITEVITYNNNNEKEIKNLSTKNISTINFLNTTYYSRTKFDDYNKFGNNYIGAQYNILQPIGNGETPNIPPIKNAENANIAYYWIKVRED